MVAAFFLPMLKFYWCCVLLTWCFSINAQDTITPQDRPKKGFVPAKYQNAHQNPEAVDTTKRNAWINQAIDSLLLHLNTSGLKNAAINQRSRDEQPYLTCRIIDAGYLTLGNDTCFIFLQSSHQNASIGDVILAISDKGRVYVNDGHVCGGIVHFQSSSLLKPGSFKDFIDRFTPELSTSEWRKLR